MKLPSRMVDISVTLDNETVLDPPFMRPKIAYQTNKDTGPLVASSVSRPQGRGPAGRGGLGDRAGDARHS